MPEAGFNIQTTYYKTDPTRQYVCCYSYSSPDRKIINDITVGELEAVFQKYMEFAVDEINKKHNLRLNYHPR